MLAGITPNSPGAGTRPASCGRPRTRPFYASIPALCARSALRAHAHERRHPIVFGMPFGARPAHVIEFGPVRIEQGPGQTLHELGKIGQTAGCPAVAPIALSSLFHDPSGDIRRLPVRSVPLVQSAPFACDCPAKFVKNQ